MELKSLEHISKIPKHNKSLNVYSVDRISELPDEILENIVSRLTIRESVATSLISRRWKHLWTYSTGTFNFDYGTAALTAMKQTQVLTNLHIERFDYLYRVFQLLMYHKGPTIDGFMMKFDLQSDATHLISRCVMFAIGKLVRRLELDLTRVENPHEEGSWVWSRNLITISKCYAFPSLYENRPDLSRLTSLNLKFVDINGKTVEYILSNCPVLESVGIISSPSLDGFGVVSACPKLKCLEIAHCHSMSFLDISSAPELTSFSYSGPDVTRLSFGNVPKLVDVSLSGKYCDSIIGRFGDLPLALSRTQKLKLSSCILYPRFCKFPELQSVTHLELEFKMANDRHSCLSCAFAIEGCPNLQRLSVHLRWAKTAEQWVYGKGKKGRRNDCLKVVEVCGFRGSLTDSDLATHIFSTSPFLNNITLDTLCLKTTRPTQYLSAQKLALRLAIKFCPAAQLCIL